MGFRSDVAIAIHKETYAKHALLKSVPKVLAEAPYVEVSGALHWYFESQKWDESYQDIADLNTFLVDLENELPFVPENQQFAIERYGLLILNEDNTTDSRGDPNKYGIDPVVYIDCPGRDALLEKEGFDVWNTSSFKKQKPTLWPY